MVCTHGLRSQSGLWYRLHFPVFSSNIVAYLPLSPCAVSVVVQAAEQHLVPCVTAIWATEEESRLWSSFHSGAWWGLEDLLSKALRLWTDRMKGL